MRKLLACIMAVASLGCMADVTRPPEGFPAAWMVTGCSPVDGPAVELVLGETVPVDISQAPYPHVHVAIDVDVEDLSGRRFTSQDNSSSIFVAQRCVTSNNCVSATDVAVEFEVSDNPSQVHSGSLRLTFSDGSSLEGNFRATVHHLLILCG